MTKRLRVVWRLLLVAATLLFATSGCVKKDYPAEGPVVSDVDLEGARAVDPSSVLDGLATARSPRFLGIWDGVVFDYEVFDETLLERDLERIERYYRARGFYEAKVTAARVVAVDGHHVRVQIRVREGPEVLTTAWSAAGLEQADVEAAARAIQAVTLQGGKRFDEADYDDSKKALATELANRGYAFVKVTGHVKVDIALHQATVEFQVTPGPKSVFGPVRIVGLKHIPEGPVRDNLELGQGKSYSASELEDARTALVNLGVFSTVDVRQDLTHPDSATVPVTVVVTEAELRTLRMGGGVRFDVIELSSNLVVGWEHRNFLGGMRKLTLETKPGLVFFPTRADNLQAPTNFLPQNRVRAELRQPSFLEGRTTGFIAGEFNVYPLLYPGFERGDPVLGYQEVKIHAGVERAFFGHHLYVTPSYNWQTNLPFAYIGQNRLHTAFVSYPELETVLDFRDDPLEPHRGIFLSNTLQVAGYLFGGDASDVREQPEVRAYVPIAKHVTLAARATVGFLFPHDYGHTLIPNKDGTTTPLVTCKTTTSPCPSADQVFNDAALRDQQLLLFRAFYSGGPDSNRGYPFRGVGPQGVLGFLIPSTAACNAATSTDPQCYRPTGGLTLWEASLELRFPIVGPLRAALFVDTSDVSRNIASIRLAYPHLSPGFGLRYATPVGPVRFDVGYRVPYLQHIGSKEIPLSEGNTSTILGLPIAIQFGLGEAY